MHETLWYDIRVLIIHPTLTSQQISDELGLTSEIDMTVGQPRQTPIGTKLPGVWPDTRWSVMEVVTGHRFFFDRLDALLDRFAEHRAFLRHVAETGGETNFIVELHGRDNIGDALSPKAAAKMADLMVSLNVEVFPEMKPRCDRRIWPDDPWTAPPPEVFD